MDEKKLFEKSTLKNNSESTTSGNSSMQNTSKTNRKVKSICLCGKSCKSMQYLNMHVKRCHPLLLKCNYCMIDFGKIEDYMAHECEIKEVKLFVEPIIQTECLKCKTLVDIGEPFDKHMKTHNFDSNTFQCFKCDLIFDNEHQRLTHFNVEHGYALCRICARFLHIDNLSNHEAYHDGLGHPCHVCKKTYPNKNLLKKHCQNTHEPSVNEFVHCCVCFKKMKLKHLKKHLSTHLHQEICGKCNKCVLLNDENKRFAHYRETRDNLKIDTNKAESTSASTSDLSTVVEMKNQDDEKIEVCESLENNQYTSHV